MSARAFNACLLVGWLLVLVGGVIINTGTGLAIAGLLLIGLALLSARIAGGVYMPPEGEGA